MAGRYGKDENTIYVEYCRSCETHNWCTHHDESKYHETFIKFSDMMTRRQPHLEIIGNMVPQHLIPFKIAENKYIDANTNKYVVFPHIGSFEVLFRGKLIFSKKDTHNWPNLNAVVSKIAKIVDPQQPSPAKPEQNQQEEEPNIKIQGDSSFNEQEEEKKAKYKAQQKGFTLTDHFKLYRPKNTFQEKEWLTEKHESQASSKNISEMGRIESREKSNKSLESKKSSDLVGQSKLKEMLKHKGVLTKQHGKKEMIIRLDSIEEENVGDQAAQATQRTQQKTTKKNRMKEIDDQINNLEDKFKNFENRVHDIQARNKEFQQGDEYNQDKNRFKQIIQNKSDLSRKLSNKPEKEGELKQKAIEKAHKLQQYLTYSEQEKNDKLHRIYGEWKLLKQFSNKNKKLLKGKEKAGQGHGQSQSQSQEETSKADSHSPSSFANIINFKRKNEKIRTGKANKQHKYSSMERYTKGTSQILRSAKNNTDNNFYNNHRLIKAKAQVDSDASQINAMAPNNPSRLVKKSFNTLSMNALKSLANNSNLPKIQTDINSQQNYTQSAKKDIGKINARISNIQQKLKQHNGGFQPIKQSPYNSRDKNYSKNSQSQQGSQNKVSIKKISNIYDQKVRNSNVSTNTIKKNQPHQKLMNSNFAQLERPQTKKYNEAVQQSANSREGREEEYKPHQSKRKEAKYVEGNKENPTVRSNHQQLTSPETGSRFSHLVPHSNSKTKKVPDLLKRDVRNITQESFQQNIKKKPIRKIQNQSQPYQPYEQNSQQEEEGNHYVYQPHQARKAKPLQRKFKDWRESQPTTKGLKSKQIQRKQLNQQTMIERKQSSSKTKQQGNKKIEKGQISQQKDVQQNKQKANNKTFNDKININTPIIEERSNVSSFAEQKVPRSGQIKKNRIVKQSIHKKQSNHVSANHQQSDEQVLRNEEEYQQSYSQQDQQQQEFQQNDEQQQQDSQLQQEDEEQVERTNQEIAFLGQKKKTFTKTLGYFKTTEMCIKGEQRPNTSCNTTPKQPQNSQNYQPQMQQKQSNEMQGEQSDGSSSFAPECKKQNLQNKYEQHQALSGWNNKSNNQSQIIPFEDQQPLQNNRQTSIESELHLNNSRQQMVQPSHQSQNVFNEKAEVQKQNDEVVQNNKQMQASVPKLSQQLDLTNQQQKSESIQQQQKDPKQKQTKKITKLVKKQNSNPKVSAKQQQTDLQQTACKQYSQFLQYKVSNDLCAQQQEKAQYQDCEYKVNLINCKSEESIPQSAPVSFMAFQSKKPRESIKLAQEGNEEGLQLEEYTEQFEEQPQTVKQDQQNKIQDAQKEETQKEESKQKLQRKQQKVNLTQNLQQKQCIIIAQSNKVPSILTNKQQASVPSIQKETQPVKGEQKVNLGKGETNTIKANTNQKQQLKNSTQNSPSNTSKDSQPNHPTQMLSEKKIAKETFDNVYSQAKKQATSKFVEMGVQKQLTIQVSIQTDSPNHHDTVITSKQNSLFEEDRAQSKRSNSRPITGLEEFDGTVKNNYFNQTRNKFYNDQKWKKEIFRAKIINQIASSNRATKIAKFETVINGNQQQIVRQQGSVSKLSSIYSEGVFIRQQNLQTELLQSKIPTFLKVIEILAERGDWILTRLFEDAKGILQEKAFGVWLCRDFQWDCFIVDDNVKVEQSNKPIYTYHMGNQKWANVLEKAIAQALGGYQKLLKAQTAELFTLLTGCNAFSIKVKEDPSKNAKLLQMINECQRKNFIVHAQKNLDKAKHGKDRQSIYYIQTVRKSNSEEQALVQISQDGRQSFWTRLSKFTQEFNRVQILQLRVNHSFTHIEIGVGTQNKITVIELNFAQSGQGCVTLTYIDHIAPLSAYLYKEEKSKVLKLVGQAREKQKSHLFFECNFNEGKYYVFAQTKDRSARLCFSGESVPALRITEEIHHDGLKNQVAEYLPIKDNNEFKPKRQMEEGWNDWRGKTPRLKDNFMESRLRENFVEYILGKTKRKDAQF